MSEYRIRTIDTEVFDTLSCGEDELDVDSIACGCGLATGPNLDLSNHELIRLDQFDQAAVVGGLVEAGPRLLGKTKRLPALQVLTGSERYRITPEARAFRWIFDGEASTTLTIESEFNRQTGNIEFRADFANLAESAQRLVRLRKRSFDAE